MSTSTLAIPSALPGGLEAGMGMHFGHCDIYTIVQIEDGAIKSVGTLPNVPHQQGGCLAPVAASCLPRRNRAPRRWHGYASAHGLPAGGRFRLLCGQLSHRRFGRAGVPRRQAPRLLHRIHLRRRESLGHWELEGVREDLSGERISRTPSKPPPPTLSKDFRAYRIPVRSFPGNRRRKDPLYHYCCIV